MQRCRLTLSRVLNGALLSSCSRFPMTGRPEGPGGKHICLQLFRISSHSRTTSSPADMNVTESSMLPPERRDPTPAADEGRSLQRKHLFTADIQLWLLLLLLLLVTWPTFHLVVLLLICSQRKLSRRSLCRSKNKLLWSLSKTSDPVRLTQCRTVVLHCTDRTPILLLAFSASSILYELVNVKCIISFRRFHVSWIQINTRLLQWTNRSHLRQFMYIYIYLSIYLSLYLSKICLPKTGH